MTREEWLRHAVELINDEVFNGDLDINNHDYQIACGRCPGKKLTEVIQPSDNEDIGLEDFFPTTIHVNFTITDPIKMLEALAFSCMEAFFNLKPKGKVFKMTAKKYEFENNGDGWVANEFLMMHLKSIYKKLVESHGKFPGKPIKFPEKEQKEKKKSSYAIFCPDCGYELKVARKIFEKHNNGLPTCSCGAKMAIDFGDEEQEEQN